MFSWAKKITPIFLVLGCLQKGSQIINDPNATDASAAVRAQIVSASDALAQTQAQNASLGQALKNISDIQTQVDALLKDGNGTGDKTIDEMNKLNALKAALEKAMQTLADQNAAMGHIQNDMVSNANIISHYAMDLNALNMLKNMYDQNVLSAQQYLTALEGQFGMDQNSLLPLSAQISMLNGLIANANIADSNVIQQLNAITTTYYDLGAQVTAGAGSDANYWARIAADVNYISSVSAQIVVLTNSYIQTMRQYKCLSFTPITNWNPANNTCSLVTPTITYANSGNAGGFWFASTTVKGASSGETILQNNTVSCLQQVLFDQGQIDQGGASIAQTKQMLVAGGFWAADTGGYITAKNNSVSLSNGFDGTSTVTPENHNTFYQDLTSTSATRIASTTAFSSHAVTPKPVNLSKAVFCGHANIPISSGDSTTRNYSLMGGNPVAYGSYMQCPTTGVNAVGATLTNAETINSVVTGFCASSTPRLANGTVDDANSAVCSGAQQSLQCAPLQKFLMIDPYDCYLAGTSNFNYPSAAFPQTSSVSAGNLSVPYSVNSPVTVRSLRYLRNATLPTNAPTAGTSDFGFLVGDPQNVGGSKNIFPTDAYAMVGLCYSGTTSTGNSGCLTSATSGFPSSWTASVASYMTCLAAGNCDTSSAPSFWRFLLLGSESELNYGLASNSISQNDYLYRYTGSRFGTFGQVDYTPYSLTKFVSELKNPITASIDFIPKFARFCKVKYQNTATNFWTTDATYKVLTSQIPSDFGIDSTFVSAVTPLNPLITPPN